MKTLILFVSFFSILVFARNNIDDRSFKVNSGSNLVIDLQSSDISLNVWTRNEVMVRMDDNDRLNISQSGNAISITSSLVPSFSDLVINIPGSINLKIKTTAGDLKLNGDLKGNLEVKNSGGNISFNSITGDVNLLSGGGNIRGNNISGNAKVKSFGGDISLGSLKGRTSIETGGGNIRINSISKAEMIKTTGGNIMIRNAAGKGVISTGAGNIDINSCRGDLDISTSGGDIRFSETEGNIKVKTGGGQIRIKNITGNIFANTDAGDVSAGFTSGAKKSVLTSGNGNIRISIAPNLSTTITARAKDPNWWRDEQTGNEVIRSDFKLNSFKRNKGNQQVESVYKVNGGGIPINIQTGHGEIMIRKK